MLGPSRLALHLFPVRSTLIRELIVLVLLGLCFGAVALFWRKPLGRLAAAVFILGAVILFAAPVRTADPAALREEYVRALRRYEGAVYVWGGERSTGIDCSGLGRMAMVDALRTEALNQRSPSLLRQAIALWWNDGSAAEMGRGYRGRLRHVTDTHGINELDHTLLQPGDVAITEGGMHAMAYLGEKRWIEADPGAMRVITAGAPGNLSWFDVRMKILRWSALP